MWNISLTTKTGDRGLFGNNAGTACVKNLTISNASITTLSGYSAIVVGYNRGRIENVKVVGGTLTVGGGAGAITGYNDGTEGNGVIISCSNSATVLCNGTDTTNSNILRGWHAGGIAGMVNKGARIEKCINTGSVTARRGAGGMTGWLNEGVIQYCVNKGTINSTVNDSGSMAGGIVGFANWVGTGNILDCYNTGNIQCITHAGGITGDQGGGGRNYYN